MSDTIARDGKVYYESGYLETATNAAKRRGKRIKALEAEKAELIRVGNSILADLQANTLRMLQAEAEREKLQTQNCELRAAGGAMAKVGCPNWCLRFSFPLGSCECSCGRELRHAAWEKAKGKS